MVTRVALVVLLSSLSAQVVDASSFGRTPGNFSVSPTGSARYSIPIWTPPGPRGIQPHLALVYNSSSGIGPLGIGWSLAGLGSITRCNLTTAQDAAPANVTLAVTDGYCLNGNRLRLTSGTYGTASSTYQTEIADFSNITANGTAGSGPASFTVQGRDGNTYLYGFTDSNGNGANSQVLASGTSTALTWLLSKIIDRAGNNLVINYTALTGTAVPNVILWTPTSAGASTYTYKLLFNYVSNVPQSSFFEYVAGTPVSNPDLLTSIELFSGTTVLKDYFLGYQASPLTGREELISFTECADSGETNCLLPTTVGYQGGSTGVSTVSTAVGNGNASAARYDFNGDGIPDLVYSNGTTIFVAFGSASGYGAPFNTGIAGAGPALFGNVTGGHEDGILTVVGTSWSYYTWNGSSFTGASTGLAYDSTSKNFVLADINGDGRPDLVSQKDTTTIVLGHSVLSSKISFQLNTSTATVASFSSTLTTGYVNAGAGLLSVYLQGPDLQWGKIRRYDFNGDGRDDLVVQVESGTAPNLTLNTYELISTGTGFTTAGPIASVPASTTFIPVFFTNWNDDRCTDFVTSNKLFVSGCNGSAAQTYSLPGTILVGLDWDGDGRTDILVQNGSTIGVYLSQGTGAPTLTSTTIPYSASCIYVWMDANGDGLDDLGCQSTSSPFPLSYFPHNGSSDLATSFADGYGVTYSPVYMPLSASGGLYTKGTSAVFPNQDYSGPMYVVSSNASSDGIGGTFTTSYTYAGAVVNLTGRGFQGFTSVSSTDSRTGFKDTRTYSTGTIVGGVEIPTAGMPLGESVTQSAGANVSVGTYTLSWLTLDSTANNQRYFPYTASSTVNTYEVQVGGSYNGQLITTTAMNYGTPDVYGNFPSVEQTVTDEDSGSPYFGQQWTTTTATTITASPSTWCNSLPTERDVTNTAPGVPAITRHLTFVLPDYTNCRQTEQVVENSNATYQVDTKYAYDPADLGNLTGVTVTGIGMTARTTTLAWGPTGQFPATITNALNQISHVSFDPNTGQILSAQDPNGTATSWQYDAFGRKIKETRPDGTYTIFEYNDCVTWGGGGCLYGPHAMAMAHYIYGSTGVGLSNGTNWLDQFDRLVIDGEMNVAGTYDRIDIRYDNSGNIAQQSMPCAYISILTPCTHWTTFTHDLVNRLTQSQRPISATNSTLQTTTIQYTGRTTATTDPQSKVTTNITKVTGSVGRTKDNDGYYINFNRDAFGSVLSVTDSLSNTLRTMTYDYGLQAFRTSLADMDLGTRSYTVDALGELTSYSDGKSQHFSTTYDPLSRPLQRTDPDLTTTWVWGNSAASFNIGKLQSISSTNAQDGTYTEVYGFDSAGRPTTTTFTIPNLPVTYTYTKTYSATTGLLDTLQYPVSTSSYALKLQYGYSHLILQSVSDFNASTTVFWTANSINPGGQIAQETLGNGVVTTRSYDAVTGWLNNILAGVGSGSAIQNNAYLYDEMGNVTQRQDNNQGLTEDFFYDNLYRLDHSTLGGAINLQMHYDVMGNITSRSDVAAGAAWTYDPVHKHQVTQAGSSSLASSYDANGNMVGRLGSPPNIPWTSTNYPITVGGPGESSTWTYGPNGKIYKSYQAGSFGDETTYHAGKLFELVTFGGNSSNYRHYIMAANELVAIYSRTFLGVNTLNYVKSDHQGNIAGITTSSPATNYVNENFTAFGNRRNGQTWSGPPTTADQTAIDAKSRWGYGGHTAIGDHTGLVHMGGRIEDAVLGRFLSPDPHTPNRYNTQSWNRYSYVTNNPMSYTDPSGFCGSSIREISAAVDFGCGGGGVNIPMGSVEGLIGTSDDGFGNLDGSGITQPFKRSNPILNVSNQGNDPSSESRAPPTPSGTPPAAQSPDPAQGNDPISGLIDELNGSIALRNGTAALSSVGIVSATPLLTGTAVADAMEAVGFTTTFLGTITDLTRDASGVAQFANTLGRAGAITGGLADSFLLGTQIASMRQDGFTPTNVSGAATSSINIGAATLAVVQPETAPAVGAFFLVELFLKLVSGN